MRRVLLCLLFAACGDNASPITLAPFAPCRMAPLECSTLTVPADWTAPDGEMIALPIVRAPAQDQANRIGVLTFNFGGPGEATLDPVARNYPQQPVATTQDLTQRFDWVLMDWRGVATTSPALSCLDAATGAQLAGETFDPQTDADWMQLFQLVANVGAGCAANASNAPLLAHMDTESAARDFDALREALGEATLNMWVVSYGTRLGSMYASLFPDRVRAIALDSPMPPAPQFEDVLTAQSVSFDAEITRFFAWCATATAAECSFRTPDGAAASVASEFESLLDRADSAPVVAQGVTLDRAAIDLVATSMMYFPSYEWPELGMALGALEQGDGTEMAKLFASGAIDYVADDNAFSAYQNVWLQDMPLPHDIATPAEYQLWTESQASLAPHVGVQNAAAQAFAVAWPAGSPMQHAIGPTTAPPLLITATRNDPATPYAGALALQQAFANGTYLVTYEGDGHANAQFQPCLGETVASFLIDPTTPPATTDCPAVVTTVPHTTRIRRPRR